jgi:putative copper export protein
LLLKVALLAGVAGIGRYNWRVVLPRLRKDGDPSRVRRTARVELALGALLLAVTAALVALPAPGEQ